MAFTIVQKKKVQQYLILGLGVLVIIIAVVLWQGFLRGGQDVSSQVSFPPARTVNINFEVLESPLFNEIQEPGPPILIPEERGRDNPFLP